MADEMTDAEIGFVIEGVQVVLSNLADPRDRAAVCMEVALVNLAQALTDAGKDVTDNALFALVQAATARWILEQEKGNRLDG